MQETNDYTLQVNKQQTHLSNELIYFELRRYFTTQISKVNKFLLYLILLLNDSLNSGNSLFFALTNGHYSAYVVFSICAVLFTTITHYIY